MFKTLTIIKNFHQQNYLTIIQEKELAQSQIPQIPNYQHTNSQEQKPFFHRINQVFNDRREQHFNDFYQNNNTIFLDNIIQRSFERIFRVINEYLEMHSRNVEIVVRQMMEKLNEERQRNLTNLFFLIENLQIFKLVIIDKQCDSFEPFMKTEIQIEKKEYQGFENQKAVYQSFENQSPKIKIEISLINQKLIKQIPTLRKRKKLHGNIDLMNSYLQIQLYYELQNLNKMLYQKLKK